MGYRPETGATIVVPTNLYSPPDGNAPATEIARLLIQELASNEGEGTGESTGGEGTGG